MTASMPLLVDSSLRLLQITVALMVVETETLFLALCPIFTICRTDIKIAQRMVGP